MSSCLNGNLEKSKVIAAFCSAIQEEKKLPLRRDCTIRQNNEIRAAYAGALHQLALQLNYQDPYMKTDNFIWAAESLIFNPDNKIRSANLEGNLVQETVAQAEQLLESLKMLESAASLNESIESPLSQFISKLDIFAPQLMKVTRSINQR